MHLDDLHGAIVVEEEGDLLARLRGVRKGEYGAFELYHDEHGPMLCVYISGTIAYLHYYDDQSGEHPGWQARLDEPPHAPATVLFLQTDGDDAEGLEMPKYALVSAELAYRAAREFFLRPARPACVSWTEL